MVKKQIYKIIQKICESNHHLAWKTYGFRKWLFIKVWNLEVCHFCLEPSRDYYCPECLAETD